jgi:tetratricopeptide (TPR) repeat protein
MTAQSPTTTRQSVSILNLPTPDAGRGDAYAGRGDYDRAIADCDRALNRDPSLAEAQRPQRAYGKR